MEMRKSKILKNLDGSGGTEADFPWWKNEYLNFVSKDGV